jgi:bacterioferritin
MRGNDEVLDALNRALTIELTAINQYFCQAKMCANWGLHKLAKKHWDESVGEMKACPTRSSYTRRRTRLVDSQKPTDRHIP